MKFGSNKLLLYSSVDAECDRRSNRMRSKTNKPSPLGYWLRRLSNKVETEKMPLSKLRILSTPTLWRWYHHEWCHPWLRDPSWSWSNLVGGWISNANNSEQLAIINQLFLLELIIDDNLGNRNIGIDSDGLDLSLRLDFDFRRRFRPCFDLDVRVDVTMYTSVCAPTSNFAFASVLTWLDCWEKVARRGRNS